MCSSMFEKSSLASSTILFVSSFLKLLSVTRLAFYTFYTLVDISLYFFKGFRLLRSGVGASGSQFAPELPLTFCTALSNIEILRLPFLS